MNKFFYGKLAISNIKKNAETYIPYILTCVLTVMMYSIIRGLYYNQSVADLHPSLHQMMGFGSWIVVIFAVIFLFYTNSFVVKRRKKEFGLFNILGMEKKHLGRVVFWETLDVALISLVGGILTGVIFSHLVYLILRKMLHFDVAISFELSLQTVGESLLLFGVIFLINFINTLRQIHLTNPIELLRGGNIGEKEPKTKGIVAVVGFACLGIGYYMAITVENPLKAMALFFVAVILVVIATYCLFTSGSILILKLLRKNKKYYYQPNHFTTVSGMLYRMKQNAAGLASICILSTGVLLLVSTTLSLFIGTEDSLRLQYPRNIMVSDFSYEDGDDERIVKAVNDVLKQYDTTAQDVLAYRYQSWLLNQEGNQFTYSEDAYSYSMNGEFATELNFIPVADYNHMAGANVVLSADEVLIYCEKGDMLEQTIRLGEQQFVIKENLAAFPIPAGQDSVLTDVYYVIVPEMAVVDSLAEAILLNDENRTWLYSYDMDMATDGDVQIAIAEELTKVLSNEYVRCMEANRNDFYVTYGGIFFLGIFLGLLFLMATVLIIYYKQVSEGYDDRERYQIMQKVGMSKQEVKRSIRSQVLNVFFLPLVVAGIHICCAFPMINELLRLFNLFNEKLFVMCTAGTVIVFAIGYAIIYGLTAKTYYKLVS